MSEIEINSEDITKNIANIQSRREARRRKILENAKERMEKLSGRGSLSEHKVGKLNNSHRTFSDPEIETEEIFGPQFPILNKSAIEPTNFESANLDFLQFFSQGQGSQINGGIGGNEYVPAPQTNTKLSKIFKSKIHLILISILTYILFITGNEKYTYYSVFLPLLLWELIETFIMKTREKPAELVFSIIFMMIGVSQTFSQSLLKAIGTLHKIFQDVGVFIFFFVLCHLIFKQFFKDTNSFNFVN